MIYIAHSKKMVDSAKALASHMGVNRGTLRLAPQSSVVLFLGVPTSEETTINKNAVVLGDINDVRKAFQSKSNILSYLPKDEKALGGHEIIIYALGDKVLSIVSEAKKTRKEFLVEKLGKDIADELITAGDVRSPEEEVIKSAKVRISANSMEIIEQAISNVSSEYDLCVFALRAKVHNDSVYFSNIMFSPNLRRVPSIITNLSKTLSDIHGDRELVENVEFVKSLGDSVRLKEIVTSATIKELGIISKFFDMARKSCVESSDEINS